MFVYISILLDFFFLFCFIELQIFVCFLFGLLKTMSLNFGIAFSYHLFYKCVFYIYHHRFINLSAIFFTFDLPEHWVYWDIHTYILLPMHVYPFAIGKEVCSCPLETFGWAKARGVAGTGVVSCKKLFLNLHFMWSLYMYVHDGGRGDSNASNKITISYV